MVKSMAENKFDLIHFLLFKVPIKNLFIQNMTKLCEVSLKNSSTLLYLFYLC